MNTSDVSAMIDHTLLSPTATKADVAAHIAEAIELNAYAVCLSPNMLPVEVPADSDLKVAVVCGFPSGKHLPEVKAAEAAAAVARGADEIDMVIDIAAALERDEAHLEAEIAAVRAAAPTPTVLKVIIESAALDDDAIATACRAAVSAGADFVKTSTGFHAAGGATAEAVRLMSQTVAGKAQIKASGGVRTMADAVTMIDAGATRLGVSGTKALLTGAASTSAY